MKNSELITKHLANASLCVAELARRGLTVTDVKIKDIKKPTISIIGFGQTPGGLQGGTMMRIKQHGKRLETYATDLHNCQVQWQVKA